MKNWLLQNNFYLYLKCGFLTSFFLVRSFICDSQTNFVVNGGFEFYVSCPDSGSEIYYAPPWYALVMNSSDFYHKCSPGFMGYPHQLSGYNYQYPFNGDGFAGIFFGSNGSSNREYIQAQMLDTLIAGTIYKISFYANMADQSVYGIKEVGLKLSVDDLSDSISSFLILTTPTIKSQDFVIDTLGWVKISGFYTAFGGERYITIGNFSIPSATQNYLFNSGGLEFNAYYFIDSISVITIAEQNIAGDDTIICRNNAALIGPKELDNCNYQWSPSSGLNNDTLANPIASPDSTTTYVLTISGCGVTISDTVTVFIQECEPIIDYGLSVFPNPNNGNFSVTYNHPDGDLLIFKLFNSIGQLIYSYELPNGENQKIDFQLNEIAAGCYSARILDDSKQIFTHKIIFQK